MSCESALSGDPFFWRGTPERTEKVRCGGRGKIVTQPAPGPTYSTLPPLGRLALFSHTLYLFYIELLPPLTTETTYLHNHSQGNESTEGRHSVAHPWLPSHGRPARTQVCN
jgi:hypothetical protein